MTTTMPTFFVVLTMILPHMMYALIWKRPGLWLRCCNCISDRISPTYACEKLGKTWKIIQYIVLIHVILQHETWSDMYFRISSTSITILFQAAVLISIGQILNISVYVQLQSFGVYYGPVLEHPIPWVKGFPFNVVGSHPQYIGCILSVIGIGILFPHLYLVWVLIVSMYLFSMCVESSGCGRVPK